MTAEGKDVLTQSAHPDSSWSVAEGDAGQLAAPPESPVSSSKAIRAGLVIVRLGPVVMLVALVIVMAFLTPLFLTERNLTNIGFQVCAIGCLALGEAVVILTRGIDISVGSIIGIVVASSSVLYLHGWDPIFVILAVLGIGMCVGLANGALYVKGRLPHPFIVTLATLGVVRGLAFLITGGNIKPGQPAALETLGNGQVGPIPYAALLLAGLAIATWVFTKRMKWGRWIYAIGGNPEGAKRVGIPVDAVLISVYIFSGLLAAIAGLITAGQIGVGDANAGNLYELNAIAAVMIGGLSYLGGRGGVSNAIVGALTVTVITNGLQLLSVSGYWVEIVTGLVIIAAVELNVLREHIEDRFRLVQAMSEAEGDPS
ncbi:MAG: ABC transporter permease [Actinobacteria bacterium]|nr:ABC transporter permease [Actinomycetota bacterium]